MITQNSAHEMRAKKYSRIKLRLSIFNLVFSISVLLFLVLSPLNAFFQELALSISSIQVLTVGAYFLSFFAFFFVVEFPLYLIVLVGEVWYPL